MRQTSRSALARWGRWLGSFVGFPLAGVTARLVAGNIDSVTAAAAGGLAGGLVLGAAQAFIAGIATKDRVRWIAATGVGLAAGLSAGGASVGFHTDASSLVAMGAISGLAVGLAQAASIAMSTSDRVLWTVATPLLWAGGWAITAQVIVDADRQHAVFGSSGAVAVSAAAGVLFAMRNRPARPAAPSAPMTVGVS
ncbi:MAG: hypothetical protein AB7L17_22850 [Ilumatobacteraceae bacterium]